MLFCVSSIYQVEVPGLITFFRDGDGLARLVNGRVGDLEPRKSEDDIFSFTRHDIKEVFLGDSFNVGEEGTGEMDFSIFV